MRVTDEKENTVTNILIISHWLIWSNRNAANVGGTSVQEEKTMNEELKGHLHITAMKFEVKRNEERPHAGADHGNEQKT